MQIRYAFLNSELSNVWVFMGLWREEEKYIPGTIPLASVPNAWQLQSRLWPQFQASNHRILWVFFSMQLLGESNQVAKRIFKSISCQKPDFHILWREREWHLSIQTSPAWCYEDIAMQRLMCSSNVLAMHVAIRLQGFDAQETLLLLHIFVETDK